MDKLRALRGLIAIADHGSLSAAARAQGSSLSATVRLLAALEDELGVRLLNRTTRRLSLTEDGRQYLERARRILADLDEADRMVGDARAEPAGALGITAPVLFGQYHVAPAVTRFLARHPRVQVRMVLLDRVVNLVEEGLDVGVRIGHLQDSTLIALRVGRVRRVVLASRAFLERHGVPRDPRDLAGLPCLCSDNADSAAWSFRAPAQGRDFKVAVQGPLQCNLVAARLQACAEGLGLCQVLSYQAAPLLAQGLLRIVLEDFEVEPWPVSITYPGTRWLPTRTRAFVDHMAEELRRAL
jgi:DNA-binding transcriptional LysR family regulator